VIGFRGQTKLFYQRAHEVDGFPPMRLFWGDRDTLIPIAHGRAFVAATTGVQLEVFEGCGHYLHQEQPEAFGKALREFLDGPDLEPARLRDPGAPGATNTGLAGPNSG
jgi:pimeloyl-ACP methyl ester carboxylesterase